MFIRSRNPYGFFVAVNEHDEENDKDQGNASQYKQNAITQIELFQSHLSQCSHKIKQHVCRDRNEYRTVFVSHESKEQT